MTTTIKLLGNQHQQVLARLAAVEAQINAQVCDPDLAGFAAYLEDEVVCHFIIEEEALFPILARHLSLTEGPLAVMNAEHAVFRKLLSGLTTALNAGDRLGQLAQTEELIGLLRTHIAKEDHVLFPMAVRLLSDEEQREADRRAAALNTATPPQPARTTAAVSQE
ncbi:MAG: hemerythrin domain-containing protein [Gaiellaceae bacterium]